jgi:hypothetical protein
VKPYTPPKLVRLSPDDPRAKRILEELARMRIEWLAPASNEPK